MHLGNVRRILEKRVKHSATPRVLRASLVFFLHFPRALSHHKRTRLVFYFLSTARLPAEATVVYYSTSRLLAEAVVVYCSTSTSRMPAEVTVIYYGTTRLPAENTACSIATSRMLRS